MSMQDAELEGLEHWAVAEEQMSVLRHDMRNRIGSIRNANFFLGRRVEKTDLWATEPKIKTFFGLVDDQLSAAETLLAEQASFIGLMPRPMARISVDACVDRAVKSLELPKTVVLVRLLEAPRPILACEAELAVMVRCLLRNAIEALTGGGNVTLKTLQKADQVCVQVDDMGPRVTDEVLSKAFQPFSTEKTGHRGIGLNVARRVCGRYGGSLALDRLPDRGLRAQATLMDPVRAGGP